MALENLIGKRIDKLFISQDKESLVFVLDDGSDFIAQAYGDCCSESWFEHISFDGLYGKSLSKFEVVKLEEIELGDVMPTRQEVDRLYGLKIILLDKETDWNAAIRVEFRNSSNGYYGGSLEEATKRLDQMYTHVSTEDGF